MRPRMMIRSRLSNGRFSWRRRSLKCFSLSRLERPPKRSSETCTRLRNEIMEDIHDWIIEQHPDDALLDMALGKFNKQLSDNGIPPLAKDDVLPEEGAETFKASREKAKNEEAGKEVPQ